jgi:FemAB-related protein (PEP-CTERM system-associated)
VWGGVMADLTVRQLASGESSCLAPDLALKAGFCGLDAWSDFVQRSSNLPVYRLVAEMDGIQQGLLSLAYVKHPVFGRYLTTAPFASYGGYAAADRGVQAALLNDAARLAQSLGVDYTLVRHEDGYEEPPQGWVQYPAYATYRVDLPANVHDLLPSFSSDHRNHIRKSLRKGFSVRFGRRELLEEGYEVIARSMHELGSPYHNREYLQSMLDTLGDRFELVVVNDKDGHPAGGGVLIYDGKTANNLHANILRKYRQDYAGEFLYWSIFDHCCELGMQTFDLGRSLSGSGNEVFKMKWKPARHNLAYWYALCPGTTLPKLNQKNPKFQFAIAVWKRLPMPLVRWIGPSLIRGLA